jgi:hypothetical protein
MEQTLETNAGQLLSGVTEIIKDYEEKWQKTGEKYNLFKVARIAHKEVIMCRVLADLMNPRGKHGQGSRYLTLFWEKIASLKLPGRPALDLKHTGVTTEYVTDKNFRIDIALEDKKVFVPVEVKIYAGDQPGRLADYFEFARKKNRDGPIPVLYLTLDGHDPTDAERLEGKYVKLSFKDDILAWLDACARENENTPETTTPVRENLRQLIAAVKSLCGKSEDKEMEDEIFQQITKNDDSIEAALAISKAANFRERVLKAFTDTTLALVKAPFSNASIQNDNDGDDWHYMDIPVRGGNYLLDVNYDWKTVWLTVSDSCKTNSASPEWAALNKKMKELFKFEGESVPEQRHVWRGEDIAWPSLESYVNNDEPDLYLAHLSRVSPQEVADRIVSIAQALESVKA